jgi:hypothetical protein
MQNRTTANVVSTNVTRGHVTDLRAARSASIPLPAHHQNRTPAKGQLMARHVSGNIPLGVHSLLAGFASMYGVCAMATGKSNTTGALILKYSVFAVLLASCCCSGVKAGMSICTALLAPLLAWTGAYDATDCESSKRKKFREGHRNTKQTKS